MTGRIPARRLTKEEAIHRIREGLHSDFSVHQSDEVDRELIQMLEAGVIEAAIAEDGCLCFRRTDVGD